MARLQPVKITRAARLGFAALAALILAGAGIYLWEQNRRSGGYQFGVHFPTAAGIGPGAQVFLSGSNIGTVSKIAILPDTSVEVIIDVVRGTPIPRTAKFSVQTTLTGSPSVAISVPALRAKQGVVPTPLPADQVWPKRVLPISEQPYGSAPLTLEIFMHDARALGNRASDVLSMARPYGKRLTNHLQNARANGTATVAVLRSTGPVLLATVQSTIIRAKANVSSAQAALRAHNQPKIAALASSFARSAADMQETSAALQRLKRDPQMRANIQAASAEIKTVTANLAKLSRDMATIAGNAQTKAELRDAGARFREILRKL